MKGDYEKLLKKLHDFLEQIGAKPNNQATLHKRLREEIAEKEKKFSAASSLTYELQFKFTERERDFKSQQKTTALYEKRVEELQQKVGKLRTENAKMLGEENTAMKLKDQIIVDLRFRVLDAEKALNDAKKYGGETII